VVVLVLWVAVHQILVAVELVVLVQQVQLLVLALLMLVAVAVLLMLELLELVVLVVVVRVLNIIQLLRILAQPILAVAVVDQVVLQMQVLEDQELLLFPFQLQIILEQLQDHQQLQLMEFIQY
jgi:hypothetical protein